MAFPGVELQALSSSGEDELDSCEVNSSYTDSTPDESEESLCRSSSAGMLRASDAPAWAEAKIVAGDLGFEFQSVQDTVQIYSEFEHDSWHSAVSVT